ncbi:glycosyltransferase family 4 protein [Photorhabdus temperata]|uniref:glycosyltransferase family 4 protein n=1 Tax=Photorhabdus temperata TaxID=574560 RepID=UPI0021D51C16|nr:glycosyltransferase family 4 protein [Photorhabdus temperata]MCT8350024.1 glycosyltransferase family 4 protein [Photorhabdus temperata]
MNILITNFHTGNGGGHTTYIMSIVKYFDYNKGKLFVACPPESRLYKELISSGFNNVVPLYFFCKLNKVKQLVTTCKTLSRIAKKQKIDVIHTNGTSDNKIAILAKVLFGVKSKIIYTKHNHYFVSWLSRVRLKKFNEKIIFVSDATRNQCLSFVSDKQAITIKNGVNTDKWKIERIIKEKGKITLISSAGTAGHKGWYLLIRCLAKDKALSNKFRIKIIGRIPYQKDIDKLVGVPFSHVDIEFTGYINDDKRIINYMKNASVGFVLSTNCETISFACREMMACSLPIIVSDFGGLPENIDHGINGWITKAGNEASVYEILKLIAGLSSQELERLSEKAREKAIKEFDVRKMVSETINIYSSVYKS